MITLNLNLNLNTFTLDDYVYFDNWISNEKELIQFGGELFSYPISKSKVVEYLTDKNRLPFKVMLGSKSVGHAEIATEQTGAIKTAKLCRILVGDKRLRGQGLGQAIINKLLVIAFNDLRVDEVYLNVYDWNIGAIKCYEKVGLSIVPNSSITTQVDSEEWTAISMNIRRDEWLAA